MCWHPAVAGHLSLRRPLERKCWSPLGGNALLERGEEPTAANQVCTQPSCVLMCIPDHVRCFPDVSSTLFSAGAADTTRPAGGGGPGAPGSRGGLGAVRDTRQWAPGAALRPQRLQHELREISKHTTVQLKDICSRPALPMLKPALWLFQTSMRCMPSDPDHPSILCTAIEQQSSRRNTLCSGLRITVQIGLLALSMPGVGLDVLGAESEGQIGCACPGASASSVQCACFSMDVGESEYRQAHVCSPCASDQLPSSPSTLWVW